MNRAVEECTIAEFLMVRLRSAIVNSQPLYLVYIAYWVAVIILTPGNGQSYPTQGWLGRTAFLMYEVCALFEMGIGDSPVYLICEMGISSESSVKNRAISP